MKHKILKILANVIFFALIILIVIYNKEISTFIVEKFIYNEDATIEITKNAYALNTNYEYVQITDDFVAKDYQQLLNIIYTILDSGEDEFYFFCDRRYKSCLNDIDALIPSSDKNDTYDVLDDINNLVHPYNSYHRLTAAINNYGKIIIKVEKQYDADEIEYVNDKIFEIEKTAIKDDLSTTDKIKAFHDYIINNTMYDKETAANMDNYDYEVSESHTAVGLLKNHLALCGGYSDIMSIYMTKLGVPNIRISADKHVWNLAYTNKQWLHLDATWDDPVTNTGAQILIDEYFLIDTPTLFKLDSEKHNYNKKFYLEAN